MMPNDIMIKISKKKTKEFENVFSISKNGNKMRVNIEEYIKLFSSDFYQTFLDWVKNELSTWVTNNPNGKLYGYSSIATCGVTSILYNYKKILEFISVLHIYTKTIDHVYILGNFACCEQLIDMVSKSIGCDIKSKLTINNSVVID